MTVKQVVTIAATLLVFAQTVEAQLFGERTIGRSTGRLVPTDLDSVGSLDGPRRFMRGMRATGDFVGSDRGDTAAFVGANPAAPTTSDAESSVLGLTEQRPPRVNRPRTITATGRYPERLSVAFELPQSVSGTSGEREALSESASSIMGRRGLTVSISPHDRSATIGGTVASEHDRRIAELLVLFEPRIETVSNQIQVRSAAETPPFRLNVPKIPPGP